MQQVNGVPVHSSDPTLFYDGLNEEPTWFSAQGGVYRCIERTSHEQVAIKKYLVEEGHHPDMFVMPKELVENEIYTMTKCVHPNILKLRAVHLHEEFVYLIMPLCTGGSLQQYVFEHHLTIGQLVLIIHSVTILFWEEIFYCLIMIILDCFRSSQSPQSWVHTQRYQM
jgi:serine/threonine protein kinase